MWNLFAPVVPVVRSMGANTRPAPAVAATTAIRLLAGGVMSVPRWTGGGRIVCRAGTVWVTREGDGADHVLSAGEALDLTRRGRVVVQALTDAAVDVR